MHLRKMTAQWEDLAGNSYPGLLSPVLDCPKWIRAALSYIDLPANA